MLSLNFLQHLAEQELIQILPNFRMKKMRLLSMEVGPFLPQSPVEVPLWLALLLKKRSKCKIIVPNWMSIESLKEIRGKEKETEEFQKVPEQYREISSLLLHRASDDFEDPELVRSLIEDIENIRQHKIREGLKKIVTDQQQQPPAPFYNLTELSSFELYSVKDFLLTGLNNFDRISSHLRTKRDFHEISEEKVEATVSTKPKRMRKFR